MPLAFARDHEVDAARLIALGAFSDAVLGFFDLEIRDYDRTRVDEQTEVLSLVGDIARKDGEPKLRIHAVPSRRDAGALGGHLLEAHVRRAALSTAISATAAFIAGSISTTARCAVSRTICRSSRRRRT